MTPETLNALADLGFAGGLILILIGGFRGWWIYGRLHDRIVADLKEDNAFWRNVALGNLRLAERAADIDVEKRDESA